MDRYECEGCHYIYDEAKGEFTMDIKPGTPFDDLPDDWRCPVCGAGKAQFNKI